METVDLHHPTVFDPLNGVHALFTLRTPDMDGGGLVEGANFGNNTMASPELITSNFATLERQHPWIARRATATQVHGGEIRTVDSPGMVEGVDGLFTTQKGLALGIQVADCAAILMADRNLGAVSAIHAGWKGAIAGIHRHAVSRFLEKGITPEDLFVFVGPCIGPQRFEVGEEVARHFPSMFVIRDDSIPGRKPHVDLQAFLVEELTHCGIPVEQIEADRRCTFENPHYFHSFRRDGARSGRMIAFIMME